MVLLLLFSFLNVATFEWEEVKYYDAKEITKQVKESPVVKSYGKGILKKNLIHFNDKIFESGNKLVIPEGAHILRLPAGLEVSKTNVDVVKHDRYAVTYEEGKLKDEWMRLKRESAKVMGVSSLDNVTGRQLERIMSRINDKSQIVKQSKRVKRIAKKYPEKIYISFILIEINGQDKLLPVVLSISPIQTLLDNIEGI